VQSGLPRGQFRLDRDYPQRQEKKHLRFEHGYAELSINESRLFSKSKTPGKNWLDSDYAAQTYNFMVQDLVVSPSAATSVRI